MVAQNNPATAPKPRVRQRESMPKPEELLEHIQELSAKVSSLQQEKEQNSTFVRIITEQHKLLVLQEYEQSLELKQMKSDNQKHLDKILQKNYIALGQTNRETTIQEVDISRTTEDASDDFHVNFF